VLCTVRGGLLYERGLLVQGFQDQHEDLDPAKEHAVAALWEPFQQAVPERGDQRSRRRKVGAYPLLVRFSTGRPDSKEFQYKDQSGLGLVLDLVIAMLRNPPPLTGGLLVFRCQDERGDISQVFGPVMHDLKQGR